MGLDSVVRLPLLDDDNYEPNTFTYCSPAVDGKPGLSDWIQIFRSSIRGFKEAAESDESVSSDVRQSKAREFADSYHRILTQLESDPTTQLEDYGAGPVNCVRLCWLRDTCLRRAGFFDPFAAVKAEQSKQALELLPAVLSELDAVPSGKARVRAAIEGVFAGNIFDLGAAASAALFANDTAGGAASAGEIFRRARAQLVPRPWAVDCLDAVLARFACGPSHRKAILFVDNAGADVVLGMLPFARELLRRGTVVVLAANEVPSINDVTAAELHGIVQRAAEVDQTLREGLGSAALRVVSSGNDLPVIDLRRVGPEVAEEARHADLVVLEGMGRGIETNLYATLACESLKLAMVKHPEVAAVLGGRLYDCVCQYHPGTGGNHSAGLPAENGKNAKSGAGLVGSHV